MILLERLKLSTKEEKKNKFIKKPCNCKIFGMKGIIAIIGIAIGFAIALYSAFGDMLTAIDFFHAVQPAIEGNTTGAVEQVTSFTSDYIIDSVYWALAITFIGSILAIFGIKIKSQ
ncbi:MAG: hypothetical protein ACUVT9_07275 [Candidatus Bathycorpusculaceae bacterium]